MARVFDRLTLLRIVAPDRAEAQKLALRWVGAADAEPNLPADIARLGGVFAQAPREFGPGGAEIDRPLDPLALAKREGRRELALEILALMGLTPHELMQIMGDPHDVE